MDYIENRIQYIEKYLKKLIEENGCIFNEEHICWEICQYCGKDAKHDVGMFGECKVCYRKVIF